MRGELLPGQRRTGWLARRRREHVDAAELEVARALHRAVVVRRRGTVVWRDVAQVVYCGRRGSGCLDFVLAGTLDVDGRKLESRAGVDGAPGFGGGRVGSGGGGLVLDLRGGRFGVVDDSEGACYHVGDDIL